MYDGMPVLKLAPCSGEVVAGMWDFVEAHDDCRLLAEEALRLPSAGGCADAYAVCSVSAAADFAKGFGEASIVADDAGAFYRDESGSAKAYMSESSFSGLKLTSDFYSDWRDLDARDARVEAAVADSGGAARIEIAGQSLEGRPIKLVRFTGKGYSPGMPKLVLTFNLHAREWITGMAGVYAVEKLAAQAEYLLAGVEVVIVYMANPDGFLYSADKDRFHRKNTRPGNWFCRGVDLNRNFNISFGTGSSGSKCSDTYHGEAAESEPETKVISSILKESPMTVFIDVHSFSQLILSSWGITKEDHPRRAEFDALGLKMKSAIDGKHGMNYKYGPIAQTLYEASGSATDFGTELGALGYCYELRPKSALGLLGFAPNKNQILPTAEECYEGILEAISYIKA